MNDIQEWIQQLLIDLQIIKDEPSYLDNVLILMVIILLTVGIDYVCRRVMLNAFTRIAKRTKNQWDDLIVERKIIHKMMHIIPALLIYILLPIAFPSNEMPQLLAFARKVCAIYIIAVSLRFFSASLNIIDEISERKDSLKNKPVKGFVQIMQVTLFSIGAILIISVLIDQSPVSLLAGLGASAAILMLVFKDTLLGFVAGIQLSANDMLRPGDWITMPKHNANGTVIEVTLYAVKVRNFDNTITTIPPYALVSDAFQNWRGMKESNGRRIKRSIFIDMTTIHFCTEEMLGRFRDMPLVYDYIENMEAELTVWNYEQGCDATPGHGRWLTNLGVFRAYLENYIKRLPEINAQMACLVRHLQPTSEGLPIEIYFFTTNTDWTFYEHLQADVFDHLLASVSAFDLAIYQKPSGRDLQNLNLTIHTASPLYRYSAN